MTTRMREGLWPRLVLVLALGAGLYFWSQAKRPRELRIDIDLSGALPGEITDVDVVVRRGDSAVARHEVHYGRAGAPGTVSMLVHAPPGEAEVEATLVYAAAPARRLRKAVQLGERPARIQAE